MSKFSFLERAEVGGPKYVCMVWEELCKCTSVNTVIKRTAIVTNSSECSLYKHETEHCRNGKVTFPKNFSHGGEGCKWKKKVDDFDLSVLRRVHHDYFKRNEIPAVKKLADVLNADEVLPSLSSSEMHRLFRKIGFLSKIQYCSALLLEATNVTQWRRKDMRQYTNHGFKLKEVKKPTADANCVAKAGAFYTYR